MRKNIVIMNIMVACYWMTLYSYVPNLPEYARSLGADAAVLGIIGGAYGIAPVILRLPIGILSDKLGKNKRMLIIGMFILLLSCGILILAQNTGVIIAGRIVAGAAAAWWVVLNATYADYHTNDLAGESPRDPQRKLKRGKSCGHSDGRYDCAIIWRALHLCVCVHAGGVVPVFGRWAQRNAQTSAEENVSGTSALV